MGLTCWVCQRPIDDRDAHVSAQGLPRRLRRYEGQSVHLRCHGEWKDVVIPQQASSRRASRTPQTAGPGAPTLLFAEDIALRYGLSRWRARRWLERLERQFGPGVVGRTNGRRGERRYTTEAALQKVGPRARISSGDVVESILERLDALERQVEALGLVRIGRIGANHARL